MDVGRMSLYTEVITEIINIYINYFEDVVYSTFRSDYHEIILKCNFEICYEND